MAKKPSLVGQTFGKLKVIADGNRIAKPCGKSSATSICVCLCGITKTIRNELLRSGKTKSCGCFRRGKTGTVRITHGHSKHGMVSEEYESWARMIQRCTNKYNPGYNNYGGRGIAICREWRDSFETFFEHVGMKPTGTSLGRIDNNQGYKPGNVRWETRTQQNRNKRSNHIFTVHGKTGCLSELAEKFGIDSRMVYGRLSLGWPPELAFTAIKNTKFKNLSIQPSTM